MAGFKTKLLLGLLILLIAVSSVAAVRTFRVQETDLVKIKPAAVDPDGDKIIYYYSAPLDENGQWQTGYDDAGEYAITITASDGTNQNREEILLTVDNKNQPPYATENKISVKEKQTIDLKELIADPDDDALSYQFEKPFDSNGLWETGYDDAGTFVTTIKASDGELETIARIEVEVAQTNRPPEIPSSFSEAKIVNVKEGETLNFFADAEDKDGEELKYSWMLNEQITSEEKSGEYAFNYESAGEYALKVIVSDGSKEVSQDWNLVVEKVNRKPELVLLPITVNEEEAVILDLPKTDLDGDELKYSFEEKFDENGVWQTGFEDAGEYNIRVYASDGQLETKEKVKVIVNDVDRPPVLNLPERLEAKEGNLLEWVIDMNDPDNDELTVTFENAPDGAIYDSETKTFSWTPNYGFIARRGGFISNILNALRLENRMLKERSFEMSVKSCAKEVCLSGTVPVTVYNTNRAPAMDAIPDITVKETELVEVKPAAVDSDGDLIEYSFSWPLGKKSGKWHTGNDDQDTYIAEVLASDGFASSTVPVNIKVTKNNREAKLKINQDSIHVNEGKEFGIGVTASDLDNDELSIRLDNMPEGASFKDGLFVWKPSFDTVLKSGIGWSDWVLDKFPRLNKWLNDDKEIIWLQFVASDGESEVVHPVKVTVKDVNQRPEIIDYLPAESVNAKISQPLVFHVAAKDPDGDELSYEWELGCGEDDASGTDTIERTFTTPGKKKVSVIVSDGLSKVKKEWSILVAEEEYVPPEEPAAEVKDLAKFKVYVIKN